VFGALKLFGFRYASVFLLVHPVIIHNNYYSREISGSHGSDIKDYCLRDVKPCSLVGKHVSD
jgi:hypothetical protein